MIKHIASLTIWAILCVLALGCNSNEGVLPPLLVSEVEKAENHQLLTVQVLYGKGDTVPLGGSNVSIKSSKELSRDTVLSLLSATESFLTPQFQNDYLAVSEPIYGLRYQTPSGPRGILYDISAERITYIDPSTGQSAYLSISPDVQAILLSHLSK